jgi:carbon monoxide dehydrogenase subunit G
MRVERRNVIEADRDAVWKIVSDPDRYPSFMTRLE